MIMRKCHLMHVALLALCIAMPTSSWALGLDEIDVSSALNERFVGSIDLLDAQGFQPSEIVVSMASREDFERVGVERFFYLTNLKFEVQMSGDTPKVKVSSSQPVSEPYLNFIVEVLWPRGRLLKEYTVLLDPPTFSQAAAPAVSAPAQETARVEPAPSQPRRTQPSAQTRPATQVAVPSSPSRSNTPRRLDGELMTTRDDTLWKIASRTRASEQVSVNQQMLAIQRKNPNAFMRNNINLLKAGYVLDLPSESEALSVNSQAAANDVAAQTDDWRSGATREQVASDSTATQLIDDTGSEQPLRSQVDASSNDVSQVASNQQGEGQVRIVANTGELASGTATGDDASVNQLIEQNEALNRQVDELNYKLDREKDIATNEVTVKDRQLEVKNQELAAAQQRMEELNKLLAEAQKNQDQNTKAETEDTPIWMSPMALFGVIGVLILILAFLLFRQKREREEFEAALDYDADAYAATDDVDESVDQGVYAAAEDEEAIAESDFDGDDQVEPFIGDLDDAEHDSGEFADDVDDAVSSPAGEGADGQTQTGDVIGEAEIYIAYGRLGQAANLLTGVLDKEPDRWDVRLKLLEVYVESQDSTSFATHAQYLLDNCEDEDVLHACRELESQLDNSDVTLVEDDSVVDADDLDSSQHEADASTDVSEEGFDLDLDDLETASSADDASVSLGEDAESDTDSEEDMGVDFELEFDDADSDEGAPAVLDDDQEASVSTGDELGGDLGLEFDPEKDVAQDTDAEAPDALEEADADLDDVLADLPDDAAEATSEADDFEFDTSDDGDVNATKLDLAEAYIDMGDADGAQDILREVMDEGSPEQQQKAQEMLDKLSG